MDKLIELLNEYENRDLELEEWEESNARTENNWHLRFNGANKVQFDTYMFDSLALSKKYWFIRWLIKKRKLDRDKFDERREEWNKHLRITWVNDYELLLMLLAIQENPTEFLVSILK